MTTVLGWLGAGDLARSIDGFIHAAYMGAGISIGLWWRGRRR